jgi:hypothetical protein
MHRCQFFSKEIVTSSHASKRTIPQNTLPAKCQFAAFMVSACHEAEECHTAQYADMRNTLPGFLDLVWGYATPHRRQS